MNYKRNFRVAITLAPPGKECGDITIFHPTRGQIRGYWFDYTNFNDVIDLKLDEFFTIDEQNFIMYHGLDRALAERVNDRLLKQSTNEPKIGEFYIHRPDLKITWELW